VTAAASAASLARLAEAAGWRLLSLLFDCPGEAWRAQVAALAREVADPELRECAGMALEQASPELYHSTFGPGGPAAPREVSYCDTLQLGYLMSELETYYAAFGYCPACAEAPDHVAVETGFLALLRMKEAFALMSGDTEHTALSAEAAERFVQEHLSRIAPGLAGRLAESGLEYLVGAARVLERRAGAAPSARVPVVAGLPVFDVNAEITCGGEVDTDPDHAPGLG
jgi:nitrate reductase assembly molybdenum cofactor insertion protein NarJ